PDDARELLAIAYTLADLPRQPLPTEARLRLRSAFIAASSSHLALWAQRNQRAATVPGVVIHRARRRLRAASTILVVSVVTLVAGSTLAFAGMFSGPDSPLYPVKQLSESILLVFNRQPVSRAEFEFKMAATRSREAEDMSLAGRGDLAVAAMRGRFDALRAAGQDLERAPRRDARWTEARNHFSSLAAQSTASIQSDLVSAHQGDAAGQIKNLTGQFQRDRQQLDAALGSATDSSSS
ncbi:MAG: DUF5667 domain-containing protein, partial [Candidatus Dormibacteraceae bacterium]